MAIKNKTRYAILGILSIGPGTGYDIKKYCDTILSNFWNENFGHIYPVLNSLLKDECIRIDVEDPTTRKKEYLITEKGKEEFVKWLIEPIEYQPVRSEFMLKFVFSHHLPREEVYKMLSEYKERHQGRLKQYREMEAYLKQDDKDISAERRIYLMAPLRYGILSAEAAIKWCDEFMAMFN